MCPKFQMYLSKVSNVSCQVYLSKLQSKIIQIAKCFVQIANLNGKKGSGTGDVENYWDLWWMVAGDYRDDY